MLRWVHFSYWSVQGSAYSATGSVQPGYGQVDASSAYQQTPNVYAGYTQPTGADYYQSAAAAAGYQQNAGQQMTGAQTAAQGWGMMAQQQQQQYWPGQQQAASWPGTGLFITGWYAAYHLCCLLTIKEHTMITPCRAVTGFWQNYILIQHWITMTEVHFVKGLLLYWWLWLPNKKMWNQLTGSVWHFLLKFMCYTRSFTTFVYCYFSLNKCCCLWWYHPRCHWFLICKLH